MMSSVKTIAVASLNPVKAEAVLHGFRRMFPEDEFQVQTVSVPSGVSDQPMTDEATLEGAATRAENAKAALPEADFWVGVEGGCDHLDAELVAFAWVRVLGRVQAGQARTALFQLPPAVAALVESGMELGDADDRIFGERNSKQANGAVGLLTGDVETRATFYEQAVVLALIPFRNPELYSID
ncbi:MAG: inosine/xanthosine triphosphatase [Chloroflexota bacterium]|nr:inosine/xanthosine triphosphatase [Chloroflexota bacterium]